MQKIAVKPKLGVLNKLKKIKYKKVCPVRINFKAGFYTLIQNLLVPSFGSFRKDSEVSLQSREPFELINSLLSITVANPNRTLTL